MNAADRPMRRWMESHPARAGTLATWILQAGSFLVQIALVPFLLHYLGAERTGQWFYLLGAAMFLQAGDFGFSQTVARQISYLLDAKKGRGERHGLFLRLPGRRGLGELIAAHASLARWGALATLGGGVLMDACLLFHGAFRRTPELALCWYALVLATAVTCMGRVHASYLSGVLRPYQERVGFGAGLFTQYAISFLGVLAVPSVASLGLAALGGALAQNVCWSRLAADQPRAARARKAIRGQLWRLSAPQGAATLSSFVAFQSNPILLGQLAGAAEVARLALPTRIAAVAIEALRATFMPQVNFIGRDIGAHNARPILVRIYRVFAFVLLAAVGTYATFALAGPAFVHWWARGQLDAPLIVFLLLAALHAIVCMENLAACFVTAHGVMPFVVPAWLTAGLNIVLMFVLIPRYGIAGSVASTLIAQLVGSTWYAFLLFARRLSYWRGQDPGFSWKHLGNIPAAPPGGAP